MNMKAIVSPNISAVPNRSFSERDWPRLPYSKCFEMENAFSDRCAREIASDGNATSADEAEMIFRFLDRVHLDIATKYELKNSTSLETKERFVFSPTSYRLKPHPHGHSVRLSL